MNIFILIFIFGIKKMIGYIKFQNKCTQNVKKAKAVLAKRNSQKHDFIETEAWETVKQASSISALREAIFTQKVTIYDVVSYYCHKAYTTGRELNLTADEAFTEALEEAKEKDLALKKCLQQGKNPQAELGSLFGIPFSVKDQIYVKGMISSMGVPSRADKVVDEDAISIKLLKDQGAIVFVKGNIAEACLTIHTENRIWGEAKNPRDQNRTTGGSSGGDAALVSCGASPFAI